MVKDIYIIGVGGFAKEICLLINAINTSSKTYNLKGFIDINPTDSSVKVEHQNYPVLNEADHLQEPVNHTCCYVIGVGNPKLIEQISKQFAGREFPNLVHPNVVKGETVILGHGNIITAGCILTVDIKIGNFNIFNLNTTVGHDTIIAQGNVFNPGVNISGGCKIQSYNLFGTNATVLQYLNIGDHNIIGASALITKPIENKGLIVGMPAKRLKDL